MYALLDKHFQLDVIALVYLRAFTHQFERCQNSGLKDVLHKFYTDQRL